MPLNDAALSLLKNAGTDPRYRTKELIRRLLKNYSREHLWRFVLATLCMVLVALMTGAMAKVVEPMVNQVFTAKDTSAINDVAIAVMAIFLVKGSAGFGHAYLMGEIGRRIVRKIQIELFGRLVHQDLATLQHIGTGQLVARLTSDANQMYNAAANAVVSFARDVLSLIVLIAVMFNLDSVLALLVFVIFPAAVLPAVALGRKLRKIARKSQELGGEILAMVTQAFQGIRHVKAYNAEDREIASVTKAVNRAMKLGRRATIASAANRPILELLTGVGIVAVLFYGGAQVIEGERTPGSFFAFISAMLLAYQPIRRLVTLNLSIQRGLSAAERLFSAMDITPLVQDKPGAKKLVRAKGQIELRNVQFAYGADAPALRNLSMSLPAGQVTALVGPSGAGKSTIFNLIPRFYDVDDGAVLVDGIDVRDLEIKSLREQIGLVSQDIVLFNDTVRTNIAYGRPSASQDEIEAAARHAFAHDFISDMPDGYDTLIGEHGVRLSGGQRQRISIARAVLKDAPILLLDEATSALDTLSEQHIQEALRRLKAGRTTLVIAHRLSTISDADLIFVMDRGECVESGTHRQLVAGGGLFAHLWALQTRGSDSPEEWSEPLAAK